MTSAKRPLRKRRPGVPATMPLLALLTSVIVLPCQAQQTDPSAAPDSTSAPAAVPADPRDVVIEELIHMLQQKNALSQDQVNALMGKLGKQPAPASASATPAPAAPAAAAQAGGAAAPATAEAAAAAAPKAAKGDVRVMYIPESEKQRIRDEVKQEVLATAKAENWAQPFAIPEWTKRISFSGDFLFRQEFDFYDSGNYPFVNYSAVNSGSPIDVITTDGNTTLPPLLNSTENREQPRLRARLGMQAKITDDLDVGFRLATGNDTNPVVTDQVFPADSNRLNFLLDQAYLNYRPVQGLSIWAGRLPNPWMFTNMVWDDDLNFDGLAIQYRYDAGHGLTPFGTLGAFSIENTSYTLSANGYNGQPSRDKWLYGAQFGADWKLKDDLNASGAVAYYYFDQISGDLSTPCAPTTATVICDTDVSRSVFMQKGNTLFGVRNPSQSNQPNLPQFQYFGLASQFRELDVLLRLDTRLNGRLHWILEGDYVNNLGFNAARVIAQLPVTNFDSINHNYVGGNSAFHVLMQVGYPLIAERGEWNVLGGYKRIESDAVLDAFTDSTFHVGGTNAKGYYIQGNLGFTHNAWLDARWFSANEVSGPALAIDVLQIDLNARF